MAAVSYTKFTDLNLDLLCKIGSYGDVCSQLLATCKKCYQVSLFPKSITSRHHELVQYLLAASAVTPTLTPLPTHKFTIQHWNELRSAFNKNMSAEEVEEWCKTNQLQADQFHLLKAFQANPFSGAMRCSNISMLLGIPELTNPHVNFQSERYAVIVQFLVGCAYVIDKMTLTLFRKVDLSNEDNGFVFVIPPQTENDPLLAISTLGKISLHIFQHEKHADGIKENKPVSIDLTVNGIKTVTVKFQPKLVMVIVKLNKDNFVICINRQNPVAHLRLNFNSRVVDVCFYEDYALVATESEGLFYYRIKDIDPLQADAESEPHRTQLVSPDFLNGKRYKFQVESGRLYINCVNAEADANPNLTRFLLDFPSGRKMKLIPGSRNHSRDHNSILGNFTVDSYSDCTVLVSSKNGREIIFPSDVMLGDERWTPEFRAILIRSKEKELWIATERGVLKYCAPENFRAQGLPNVLAQIEQKNAASKRQKV